MIEPSDNRQQENVARIIAQVPGWAGAADLEVEPLAGLTNRNLLITAGGERFVLRICRDNGAALGIDRALELAALHAASSIGVGPEVVHAILPQGHLVTRYIPGRTWTYEEYCTPETVHRVVETVKRVHALPATAAQFSPFRRIESYARQARALHVPLPAAFDDAMARMRAIEDRQQADGPAIRKLCHNDLFSVNFLDDGSVRLLDWEFAGMGDPYFDLATLVYAYDSVGPLPAALEAYLLACYFGEVDDGHRARLQDMKYMVHLFAAMWGVLHCGLQRAGVVPPVEGFDYLEFAQYIFQFTLQAL
ncbi:MAG: choline/ethanolamine kinase family protein [Anaerolineae bacterium]|jgi:thiamine kinase-like enzyme